MIIIIKSDDKLQSHFFCYVHNPELYVPGCAPFHRTRQTLSTCNVVRVPKCTKISRTYIGVGLMFRLVPQDLYIFCCTGIRTSSLAITPGRIKTYRWGAKPPLNSRTVVNVPKCTISLYFLRDTNNVLR